MSLLFFYKNSLDTEWPMKVDMPLEIKEKLSASIFLTFLDFTTQPFFSDLILTFHFILNVQSDATWLRGVEVNIQSGHMTCNTPLWPVLGLDVWSLRPNPINWLVLLNPSNYMTIFYKLPLWQTNTQPFSS